MKRNPPNNKQIEQWAVDAIGNALSTTDTLDRFIKENDKTPLWDGEVFIYKNNNWINKNLVGKTSVQIKGKLVDNEEYSKSNISYSVKIVDLENYKNNGGTIYFVVQINKNSISQKTIYYETLTPQRISFYLKGKEQQETCTINFKRLPSNKYDIQNIFHNFYNNSNTSGIPSISLDELLKRNDIANITSTITHFFPITKKVSPIDAFLENELYWTVELNNYPVQIPIELDPTMQLSIITKEGLPSIIVNDVLYDDYYSISRSKNHITYKFGDSTRLIFNKNTKGAKLKFTLPSSLTSRIKDLSFLINLIETNEIQVSSGNKLSLGELIADTPFDIENTKKELEYYREIDAFWKSLNINKDFNIGEIDSNSSLEELDILMNAIKNETPISLKMKGNYSYYLLKKKISNFLLLLFLKTEDKEKSTYKIYNYFDLKEHLHVSRGDTVQLTSIYSALTHNDYLELSNIDFSKIIESYKEILPLNNEIFEQANIDLLNLLLAYDLSNDGRTEILTTAKELAKWILDESDNIVDYEINIINYLQVIKRERKLNNDENEKLFSITESSENITCKLGANLLLENYKVARIQFHQLSKEEKDSFKSFPIYRFWSES